MLSRKKYLCCLFFMLHVWYFILILVICAATGQVMCYLAGLLVSHWTSRSRLTRSCPSGYSQNLLVDWSAFFFFFSSTKFAFPFSLLHHRSFLLCSSFSNLNFVIYYRGLLFIWLNYRYFLLCSSMSDLISFCDLPLRSLIELSFLDLVAFPTLLC